MAKEDVPKKADVKRSKKIATQERNREKKEEERRQREAKRNAKRAIGILTKPPGGSPGVPKSEAHKAAISAAVKAKWADPAHVAKLKQTVIERRMRGSGVREREAREIRSQLQELSPQERKRAKLVQEMKGIYTKATAAVNALEKRKREGLEVDEAMLGKALVAVEAGLYKLNPVVILSLKPPGFQPLSL
jgi:hypothetical protein